MRETLVILLSPSVSTTASWVPVDDSGRAMGSVQRGALEAAGAMAGGRRVVVVVPSESILLTRVTLPGVRGARLRQAVPFALEDRLIDDVEELHFAVGDRQGDDIPVAVVDQRILQTWCDDLAEAGLDPAAITPDCLAIPFNEGQPAAVQHAGRVIFRDGVASGFAAAEQAFNGLQHARGGAVVEPTPLSSDALLQMLLPQALSPPINLLQGGFARSSAHRESVARWRIPIGLGAAWAVLSLGLWVADYRAVVAEQRALQGEIAEMFQSLLPGEPMVDPRLQIQRRLGGGGASSGEFLTMLAVLAEGMAVAGNAEIGSISYRQGSLEVSVTTQRAEQVEQLRERMTSEGNLAVSIESASGRGDRVEGRLLIRAGDQ